MENGGVSDKELLVAGYNKGCRKICERVRSMPKNEEYDREVGRKAEVK